MDGIIRAARKATELTRQLLAFSRKQTVQIVESDLNSVIHQTARMTERLIGEDITLRLHLDANIPPVLADHALVEQLLLNLAITARDAMPAGGNLSIHTSYIAPGQNRKFTNGWDKGAISLRVEDTGRGIPREDLPHIFEPFFRTRTGADTALRLATVYGIVQQHNGRIEVESEVGLGTRFTILFPAMALPGRPTPRPETARSSGTILIVEDSTDLRVLLRELLIDCGYQTMESPTCASARQLFEISRDRISLVIADVCLEDGSGRELVRHLRHQKATLKAILITGYDPHQMRGRMDLQPNELFLAKPFQTEELLHAIETLLAG